MGTGCCERALQEPCQIYFLKCIDRFGKFRVYSRGKLLLHEDNAYTEAFEKLVTEKYEQPTKGGDNHEK
jgi:hypothetical protein